MAIPTKFNDTTIEIDNVIPAIPEKVSRVRYDRKFIEQQILGITAQRDEMIALKTAKLKECTDILKEMDILGITTEVIEP